MWLDRQCRHHSAIAYIAFHIRTFLRRKYQTKAEEQSFYLSRPITLTWIRTRVCSMWGGWHTNVPSRPIALVWEKNCFEVLDLIRSLILGPVSGSDVVHAYATESPGGNTGPGWSLNRATVIIVTGFSCRVQIILINMHQWGLIKRLWFPSIKEFLVLIGWSRLHKYVLTEFFWKSNVIA